LTPRTHALLELLVLQDECVAWHSSGLEPLLERLTCDVIQSLRLGGPRPRHPEKSEHPTERLRLQAIKDLERSV